MNPLKVIKQQPDLSVIKHLLSPADPGEIEKIIDVLKISPLQRLPLVIEDSSSESMPLLVPELSDPNAQQQILTFSQECILDPKQFESSDLLDAEQSKFIQTCMIQLVKDTLNSMLNAYLTLKSQPTKSIILVETLMALEESISQYISVLSILEVPDLMFGKGSRDSQSYASFLFFSDDAIKDLFKQKRFSSVIKYVASHRSPSGEMQLMRCCAELELADYGALRRSLPSVIALHPVGIKRFIIQLYTKLTFANESLLFLDLMEEAHLTEFDEQVIRAALAMKHFEQAFVLIRKKKSSQLYRHLAISMANNIEEFVAFPFGKDLSFVLAALKEGPLVCKIAAAKLSLRYHDKRRAKSLLSDIKTQTDADRKTVDELMKCL